MFSSKFKREFLVLVAQSKKKVVSFVNEKESIKRRDVYLNRVKIISLLVLFMVSANCLFSQETKSKNEIGIHMKASLSHDYPFKLNTTLKDIGCKKMPDLMTFGGFGLYYDIKKVELTLDALIGGMYDKKTRVLAGISSLSAGYKLTLPKKSNLIFACNVTYTEYSVFTHSEKGNLDFQNSTLTNSTMFNLELYQLMAGPKITWRYDNFFNISVGYDFGCIPTRWKSSNVNISNSPKERIDRIYFDIGIILLRY